MTSRIELRYLLPDDYIWMFDKMGDGVFSLIRPLVVKICQRPNFGVAGIWCHSTVISLYKMTWSEVLFLGVLRRQLRKDHPVEAGGRVAVGHLVAVRRLRWWCSQWFLEALDEECWRKLLSRSTSNHRYAVGESFAVTGIWCHSTVISLYKMMCVKDNYLGRITSSNYLRSLKWR